MAVRVGDRVPSADTLKVLNDKGSPKAANLDQILANKKVVMFGVPGAFTPQCSDVHLPDYVANYDKLIEKGLQEIICIAVNDAWTMAAWRESQNAENILMLADGSAELTKKLGLEIDLNAFGLGIRSSRYAMVIENGVISYIGVEKSPKITVSGTDAVLASL